MPAFWNMAVVDGSSIMLMPPTRAEVAASGPTPGLTRRPAAPSKPEAAAVLPVRAERAMAVATRDEEQAVSTLRLGPFRPKW